MTFVLFKNKGGYWMFNLVARNGKIIAVSEAYSSLSKCKGGVNSVRKCARAGIAMQEK
ncbi:MAG: DUF1508 domain-containing protein [Sulfurimonas sp.]|jgi:hypothetical protein